MHVTENNRASKLFIENINKIIEQKIEHTFHYNSVKYK